jgi:hypothetical protein
LSSIAAPLLFQPQQTDVIFPSMFAARQDLARSIDSANTSLAPVLT